MTIDNVLGITGVVSTLYLGFLGLKYTLKYRKKTEIIFLKHTSISLFKTIVKNLEDIEINFQGKKIDENLILFKGTFFNNGNIDIEKSIIHKPLEIELPQNYTWVMNKLIDSSDGLEVNTTIRNNKLIFEWDLLKEGEYFTFDSLVEYKSDNDAIDISDIGKKLLKDIKISHRITDLKNIIKENSVSKPTSVITLILISMFTLGISVVMAYKSIGQLFFPKFEVLTEANLQDRKQFVKLKAIDENSVTILNQDNVKIATFSKDELSQKIGSNVQISKTKIDYFLLFVGGTVSLVYFIAWIAVIVSEVISRRIYKKLKMVAEKYDDLDNRKFLVSNLPKLLFK